MGDSIKCLVCDGEHFKKGYYDVDVNTNIYSSSFNKAVLSSYDYDLQSKLNVDVQTEIHHDEILTKGELDFYLNKEKNDITDSIEEVYKYVCEECGFIMSFTKKKNAESEEQKQERTKRERMYDWTGFKEQE